MATAAAGATGNAAAWVPGNAKQGRYESHRHPAVLVGYKSQELATSDDGCQVDEATKPLAIGM